MKIEFTIQRPHPLVFVAEVKNDTDAWSLSAILSEGQNYPVTFVRQPYQPEPDAPWPIGPTLADT